MFCPLEWVCKVKYCRTEKQDGVIALGASYIRELMSGFFINRLGDSHVIKINLVTWNQRIPSPLHLCVRRLQCEYSEQFLDTGKVLE